MATRKIHDVHSLIHKSGGGLASSVLVSGYGDYKGGKGNVEYAQAANMSMIFSLVTSLYMIIVSW